MPPKSKDKIAELYNVYTQIQEGNSEQVLIPRTQKDFEENFRNNPEKLDTCMKELQATTDGLREITSELIYDKASFVKVEDQELFQNVTDGASTFLEGVDSLNETVPDNLKVNIDDLGENVGTMNDLSRTFNPDGMNLIANYFATRLDLDSQDLQDMSIPIDAQDFEQNFRNNSNKLKEYRETIQAELRTLRNTTKSSLAGEVVRGDRKASIEYKNQMMSQLVAGVEILNESLNARDKIDVSEVKSLVKEVQQRSAEGSINTQDLNNREAIVARVIRHRNNNKLNKHNPMARMDHTPGVYEASESFYDVTQVRHHGRDPNMSKSSTSYAGKPVDLSPQGEWERQKIKFNTPAEQKEYIAQQSNNAGNLEESLENQRKRLGLERALSHAKEAGAPTAVVELLQEEVSNFRPSASLKKFPSVVSPASSPTTVTANEFFREAVKVDPPIRKLTRTTTSRNLGKH
jgi:hypothetical protein